MTLKNLVDKQFCLNKLIILKGYIQGAISNFQEPIKNTTSLWDFEANPIFTSYLNIQNAYIVISKYQNVQAPIDNPYFNIQIIYLLKDGNNLLELGTAQLFEDKLKFNLTETSSSFGEIIYDCKKDIFNLSRLSVPPNLIFMDGGEFNLISVPQFEIETGIKV